MFGASIALLWLMLLLQSPAAAGIAVVPILCGAIYARAWSYGRTPRLLNR
jgi:hypothetical protein